MKKIFAILLSLTILASASSCGKKEVPADMEEDIKIEETTENTSEENKEESKDEDKKQDSLKDDKKENGKETTDNKKEESVNNKKEEKPLTDDKKNETTTPQANKPAENKPEEVKPSETKPSESKPSSGQSVGNILLSEFKSKAGSGASAEAIANALISNPIIPFMGAVSKVEPGCLAGFGNAEITGFSEGYTFGPSIGAIPFVGYVFTLEAGTDAGAFLSNLKSNADLRWNICSEADEAVSGQSGNKVFFVMAPKNFEE